MVGGLTSCVLYEYACMYAYAKRECARTRASSSKIEHVYDTYARTLTENDNICLCIIKSFYRVLARF